MAYTPEQLEEAAYKYVEENSSPNYVLQPVYLGFFKAGAEWAALQHPPIEVNVTGIVQPKEAIEDDIVQRFLNKHESLKNFATKFFYYWWNQKGNNTEQGFYQWMDTKEANDCVKEIIKQFAQPNQEATAEDIEEAIKEAKQEAIEPDGWISVEDRLPDKKASGCIVTNNINAVDSFGQMSHIWIVSMIHKKGKRYSAFSIDDFEISDITHWHKLPSPPKK